MTHAKVKVTFYPPEEVHRRLKIRAVEERNSMTDLVPQAIADLLRRPPAPRQPKARSPLLAESR